jgi:hypothetical protein
MQRRLICFERVKSRTSIIESMMILGSGSRRLRRLGRNDDRAIVGRIERSEIREQSIGMDRA